MRIATLLAGVLLILTPAIAQDEAESLKRVQSALAEGDLATATTEIGFPVAEETAKEVGEAVAERIQVLEEAEALREWAKDLPEPDNLLRQEERAIYSLELLKSKPQPGVPAEVSEDALVNLRSRSEARSAEEAELRSRLRERKDHLQEITRVSGTLEGELEGAQELLVTLGQMEPEPLVAFRKETVERRVRLLREKQDYATRAPSILKRQIETVGKQADLALQKLLRSQAELEAAEEVFNRRLDRQAEEAERLFEDARDALSGIEDPIKRFEQETLAEAHRIRAARLRASIALDDFRRIRTKEEKNQTRYRENYERITAWFMSRSRVSDKDGRFLLSKLDEVQAKKSELRKRILPQLREAQERYIFEQAEAQTELWNLETPVEDGPAVLIDLRDSASDEQRDAADQAYSARVEEIHDPLEAYTEILNEIVSELEITSDLYAEQVNLAVDAEAFIVGRMFWVRNVLPVGKEYFGEVSGEVRTLIETFTSASLLGAVKERYVENRSHFGIALGAILVLAVVGILLTRRLARIQSERKYRGGPLAAFVQRLIVLVVISGVGPACLVTAGQLLPLLDLPEAVGRTATRALIHLAQAMFLWRIALRLFREGGIAEKRLGVSPDVARQLSHSTRLAALGFMLFLLPSNVLQREPYYFVHLPRLFDMAALLWFSLVLLRLFHWKRPLTLAVAGQSGFWRRSAGLIWWVLALSFVTLLGMAALGYDYGARFLLSNVLKTLAAVVGLTALYRFLTAGVRRAARRAGFYKREAAEEAIRQVSRLYGIVGIAVVAVLLGGYWDLGELFRRLFEGVRLATVDGESGTYLTLWNVLVAVIWVTGGHLVARNLHGVFELFLFPRMERSDTGTRFVINTLSKYAVLVVAYCAAILTLHFRFSTLGWLLTAASVGIGFGLQEIISNFISGLILFFERPVRVGDVVTVGATTGTVERIAIRATHVTNFDRQVIIIPNRRLIVDDVVNWTHNDRVIRCHVYVGVAYGTDVDRVVEILEEIAKNHPKVKKFPRPEVLFDTFGDSSLDLEIRVYVDINDRVAAASSINKIIARRFAEEGIQIPFPQRDLHVITTSETAVSTVLGEGGDGDGEQADPEA